MKASTPELQTQKLQGDLPWAGDHAGIEAEDVWHLKLTWCRWLDKAKGANGVRDPWNMKKVIIWHALIQTWNMMQLFFESIRYGKLLLQAWYEKLVQIEIMFNQRSSKI